MIIYVPSVGWYHSSLDTSFHSQREFKILSDRKVPVLEVALPVWYLVHTYTYYKYYQ